jgi:hypothetical protein
VVGVDVLLAYAGEDDVRRDRLDEVDDVADRALGERARKHLPGELRDRLAADEPHACAGDPGGMWVEQREEALDVLLSLCAFELGDSGGQGVDGRLRRLRRDDCR